MNRARIALLLLALPWAAGLSGAENARVAQKVREVQQASLGLK